LIPERFRFIYSLNPITALIESVRSIFLMGQLPSVFDVAVIVLSIAVLLTIGFLIFRRLERGFAEEL
jgi:ABC-2 type transport system permease protein